MCCLGALAEGHFDVLCLQEEMCRYCNSCRKKRRIQEAILQRVQVSSGCPLLNGAIKPESLLYYLEGQSQIVGLDERSKARRRLL
jgi:hypothetical protein